MRSSIRSDRLSSIFASVFFNHARQAETQVADPSRFRPIRNTREGTASTSTSLSPTLRLEAGQGKSPVNRTLPARSGQGRHVRPSREGSALGRNAIKASAPTHADQQGAHRRPASALHQTTGLHCDDIARRAWCDRTVPYAKGQGPSQSRAPTLDLGQLPGPSQRSSPPLVGGFFCLAQGCSGAFQGAGKNRPFFFYAGPDGDIISLLG